MNETIIDNYGDSIEVFTYPKVYVAITDHGNYAEVSLDPEAAFVLADHLRAAAMEVIFNSIAGSD